MILCNVICNEGYIFQIPKSENKFTFHMLTYIGQAEKSVYNYTRYHCLFLFHINVIIEQGYLQIAAMVQQW